MLRSHKTRRLDEASVWYNVAHIDLSLEECDKLNQSKLDPVAIKLDDTRKNELR
jgi:hypothetical protein